MQRSYVSILKNKVPVPKLKPLTFVKSLLYHLTLLTPLQTGTIPNNYYYGC